MEQSPEISRILLFNPEMRIATPCLICKSFLHTKSGFCLHCAGRLFELRDPRARSERGLDVHSLFAWRKDGIRAFTYMVKSLKGREDVEPWEELALWMVSGFSPRRLRTLIPIPSAGPNHALGLAKALSKWTQWPVENALEMASPRQQKRLSRLERRGAAFTLKICKDFSDVAIIDDVVTTGATALAAFHALGRPRNCEVWCLMDRRPCGRRGTLL
jgi:predicted amidophosphoribosyltransferase